MGVSSFIPAFGSFTLIYECWNGKPIAICLLLNFYLVFYCFLLQYLYILFVHLYAQC